MAHVQTKETPAGKRYQVRWVTPDGKHRTKVFPRSKEADAYRDHIAASLRRGDYLDAEAGRIPYREVAEAWMASIADKKPRTLRSYRLLLDHRLFPIFGDRPVGRIKPSDVRTFLASMKADGRKPQTIRNAFFVLQSSLDVAVEGEKIKANPCRKLEKKRVLPKAAGTKFEAQFLTPAEIQRLADAIEPPYSALVYLAAYTGLRAGELFALCRYDLDLPSRTIEVSRSRATTGPPAIDTTKTDESRTVPFPRFIATLLAEYLLANPRDPADFLFDFPSGPRGSNGYARWYSRHFNSAKRAAGFPNLRFHDLRHTAASLMIASGASVTAVADRLGHKTVSMTLNRYAKHFRSQDEAINDGLERAYREAR